MALVSGQVSITLQPANTMRHIAELQDYSPTLSCLPLGCIQRGWSVSGWSLDLTYMKDHRAGSLLTSDLHLRKDHGNCVSRVALM